MNPAGVLPARRLGRTRAGKPAGPAIGAVVLGGDYQGLGIVRSLGRRDIPVWILDDELSIGRFSRYATGATRSHLLRDEQATVDALRDLAARSEVGATQDRVEPGNADGVWRVVGPAAGDAAVRFATAQQPDGAVGSAEVK